MDQQLREEFHYTEKDIKDLAKLAYIDPTFFCKFFLEHLFPGRIPSLHKGILAILCGDPYAKIQHVPFLDLPEHKEDLEWIIRNFVYKTNPDSDISPTVSIFGKDNSGKTVMQTSQYQLIMMPRGFSKTTYAGIAVPIREIVYQENPLTLFVSETGNHARMQLGNTRRELANNKLIHLFFGNLKPKLSDEQKWSGDLFETTTEMAMIARGRGGQIRGLNHNGHRPRKILVDDLEDLDSVATEEQRRKTRKWAYGDLMPALPKVKRSDGKHPGRMVALGTLRHKDALLQHWRRDVDKWTTICFGALDLDGQPIWPENMNLNDLATEKLSFSSAGMLPEYYLEYHNEINLGENAKFKEEYFHYTPPTGTLTHAIYIDPAIGENEKADECVIIVAAMNEHGQIWIIEGHGAVGMSERAKTELYFLLQKKYNCRLCGVEAISYQRALVSYMQEAMHRKKQYFEIEAIKSYRNSKYERIVGVLSARFANGFIHFAQRFPKLNQQLLDLRPDVEDKDDWADACAGVVQLLDPISFQAATSTASIAEDEFEPLGEEYFQH